MRWYGQKQLKTEKATIFNFSLGSSPLDRLYSSQGSNSSGSSVSRVTLSASLPDLTGHWYLVLPRNIWTLVSDLYHNHHTTSTNYRLNLGSPNCHFRSFSGKVQFQLSLLDRSSELFLTFFLPAESSVILGILLLVALNPMSDSSSSSLFFRSHEAWQLMLLSADAAAFFLVFQTIYKRLMLYYKTLPLICLAWYLHSREVIEAAVRQMRAAEYLFFRPSIGLANTAGARGFGSLAAAYRRYSVNTISGGVLTGPPGSQRLSAAIGTIWITVFMREHCKLLVDLVHLNRHLVSPLLFWFYSPVLVSSVYILCLLYFMPLAILLKLSLLSVFIVSLITFALLAFLSLVVRTLYNSLADSQLFRAQMLCRGSSADGGGGSGFGSGNPFLRTKLKLMTYYEVLRTEKKVAFTFGSHSKVTNRWLWEVNHFENK